MLRFFFFILMISFFFTSCSTRSTEKYYTQEEINHLADSIMDIRIPQIKKEAEENFKLRLSIELKPKVDSILNRITEDYQTPQLQINEEEPDSLEMEEFGINRRE